VKLFTEAKFIEPVSNETVPPTEVVTDQEHRPAGGICSAIKLNIVKISFQAIPRVETDETDKEGDMSCLDHFEPVIEISDLWGLR
jgi:hypothetical protein